MTGNRKRWRRTIDEDDWTSQGKRGHRKLRSSGVGPMSFKNADHWWTHDYFTHGYTISQNARLHLRFDQNAAKSKYRVMQTQFRMQFNPLYVREYRSKKCSIIHTCVCVCWCSIQQNNKVGPTIRNVWAYGCTIHQYTQFNLTLVRPNNSDNRYMCCRYVVCVYIYYRAMSA